MKIETRNRKAEKLEEQLKAAREEIARHKNTIKALSYAQEMIDEREYLREIEIKGRAIYRAVRDYTDEKDNAIPSSVMEWHLSKALTQAGITHSHHWATLKADVKHFLWIHYNVYAHTRVISRERSAPYTETYYYEEDLLDFMDEWGALITEDSTESYEAYLKELYSL